MNSYQGNYENVKPGDTIIIKTGPCREMVGKAYGKIQTRWGKDIRVKMADETFEIISGFTSVGIGAYWTPDSRIR